MGQLCIYLPPFAADYSGVASALWDLHALVAINDASCCTSHYVYNDEPRWEREVRPVFCTTLRNADAILGSDDKVISQVCEAAEELDAKMIALVGTPVPALVGMDMRGVAAEVEARCGRPAFGFDTTGFSYYDKGIAMAGRALLDRLAEKTAPDGSGTVPGRVNIVGMTPLDWGDVGNDAALADALADAGYEVGCRAFMGLSAEQLAGVGTASLNVAASAAGVVLARYLERRFGTPWVAELPEGVALSPEFTALMANKLAGQRRVLIVADQVIANMLRAALRAAGADSEFTVASFFTWDRALAEPGDIHLKDEVSYLRLLREGGFTALAADPFLCDIPQADGLVRTEVVHPAVSSKLHWADVPRFFA